MRKPRYNGGFILSFLLNLVLNFEWAVIALVLFILGKLFRLSIMFAFMTLGIWIFGTLLITLFLFWVSRHGSASKPKNENKNPYSAKNSDVFPNVKKSEMSEPSELPTKI